MSLELDDYHIYAAKRDELWRCVGWVISNWAKIEFELLHFTAWGLGSSLEHAAKVTSSFKTFALTLDFANTLCAAKMPDTRYFYSLVDYIRELSGDRNYIAHTQIASHGPKRAGAEAPEPDWSKSTPKIGPPPTSYLLDSPPKREAMDGAEVREIAEDIQHAVSEAKDFLRALTTGDALPAKFQQPIASRRPRLAERRAQNVI